MNPLHTGTPSRLTTTNPTAAPAVATSQKNGYGTALDAHHGGLLSQRFTPLCARHRRQAQTFWPQSSSGVLGDFSGLGFPNWILKASSAFVHPPRGFGSVAARRCGWRGR